MKVGINYISSIPEQVIEQLVKDGIINILKFPSTKCTQEELSIFLSNLPNEAKADPHGLLNFKPAWNAPNIAQKATNSLNQKLFAQTGATHFSTHIGQFPGDGDPIENFEKNLKNLRKLLPGIQLGGENVFALLDKHGNPQYMTLESSKPEFINWMWERLDFAVFDIAHAKIAAMDHKMSFEAYVEKLNKEKVKIIHISGGIPNLTTGDSNDADPHTPCTEEDFEKLKDMMKLFPNTQIVISELAYSRKAGGGRAPLKVLDYINEAKLLKKAVQEAS